MAGPLPVSSSRRLPSRTSAHFPSGFLVPATPHRSAKHRDVTALVPNGPPLPSSLRIGHTISNTTPRLWRTDPSGEISESKQSLAPRLKQELQNHIVQVRTEAFVLAVLYKGAEKEMKQDEDLAAKCFDTLRASPSPHEGRVRTRSMRDKQLPTSNVPPDQKLLLPTHYPSEAAMYERHVSLLNYVAEFFGDRRKDIDSDWAPAQQPTFPPPTPQAGTPLKRVFRDTHKDPRSFSRYNYGQAGLKPDLCLLIQPGDEPKEPKESEGKPKKSGGKPKVVPSEDKPKTSGDKPKVVAHWKDVVVAFELKPDKNPTTADLIQMAGYARSLMLEQFDRIFVITILINGTSCRLFHWDVGGAQVTEPFDTRSALFIQVMGRLATMTPAELGYDTHFSNAGRVRSTEIDNIKTHLTIHLSPVRPFFVHEPTSSTGECSGEGHKLVVDLKHLQFESEGLLFNRATRVWTAKPVNDPPSEAQDKWSTEDTYIVKQNWADDRQPNEGFLHTKAEQVKAVPPLVGMEERQFTSSFRARFKPEEVLGVLGLVDTIPPKNSARRSHSRLRGDVSQGYKTASTVVGDANVNGGAREDISVDDVGVDDVGSDAASEEDEDAGGYLAAADFGDEEDVGDEEDFGDDEDVADQQVASNAGANDEDANRSSRDSLERGLVRFVFARVGRPLNAAKDSVELLQATEQWITGLIELDKLGIIHRDISFGNLLLPPENDENGTRQAIIIDFGLAHLSNPDILKQLLPSSPTRDFILQSSQPHDRVTGTLPFVAHELLEKFLRREKCMHQLHHDIESVFWVLLFICIKKHYGSGDRFDEMFQALTSHNVHQVRLQKIEILSPRMPGAKEVIHGVGGNEFPQLGAFLEEFLAIWRSCWGEKAVNLASEIRDLASRKLQKAQVNRKKRKTHISGLAEPTPSTKKPKHQKKAPYADD